MDLNKRNISSCQQGSATFVSFTEYNVISSPAEKGLCEVVLGSILRLHTSLQQHLLVKLSLLLLLLQVLPHAETLPVILLDVLCGIKALDTHAKTQSVNVEKQQNVVATEDY